MEVRRVDLANRALRTSPKFTTRVKYQLHKIFFNMEWIPIERNKKGRPKKTWMEGVQEGLSEGWKQINGWTERNGVWFTEGNGRSHDTGNIIYIYIYIWYLILLLSYPNT